MFATGVEIGQDPSPRNGWGVEGAGVGCSEWGGMGWAATGKRAEGADRQELLATGGEIGRSTTHIGVSGSQPDYQLLTYQQQ